MPPRDIQIVTKSGTGESLVRHVRDLKCGHDWDVPPASDQKDAKGRFVCPFCAPGQ